MLPSSIDDALRLWKEALASSDATQVAALVTGDAEFWSHGSPAVTGKPAVEALFAKFFDQYAFEQEFEEIERIVSGDVALVRGTETNVLRPRAGGSAVTIAQRAFTVLRRDRDGRWLFARGMTNLAQR
jgi:uncharacterized protein (TIGR02246 family)